MVLVPSPVHEATSALPHSADNIGSTLYHLVKPRIEIADSMLADEKRSVEGLFNTHACSQQLTCRETRSAMEGNLLQCLRSLKTTEGTNYAHAPPPMKRADLYDSPLGRPTVLCQRGANQST